MPSFITDQREFRLTLQENKKSPTNKTHHIE